jgi:hypothetical protein
MSDYRERPRGIKGLLKSQWFADCTLVCKRGKLEAHRAILCAKSGFFSRALASGLFDVLPPGLIQSDSS